MSVTLSRYDEEKDKDRAGYFRIGFVTLQIPPEDIVTHRVANNDKIATLRSRAEMHTKSGQARWDVVIKWTAIKGEAGDVSQWEQLTDLVAMFKVAPFVEVESPHLRQVFAPLGTQRMAVALRQMRIDTHPDIVDGLCVTLTMSLFNYNPYSVDFAYLGSGTQPGDAYRSDAFKLYIQTWKSDPRNMPDWHGLTPGVLKLGWRQYMPVATGATPEVGPVVDLPSVAGVPPVVVGSGRVLKGQLPANVQGLLEALAPTTVPPIPLAIAKAMAMQESGGDQKAVSNKGAIGVLQLEGDAAAEMGVTDRTDLRQNVTGGLKYLAKQKRTFGTWPLALAAYNAGPGAVEHAGRTIPYDSKHETIDYVANIMATARRNGFIDDQVTAASLRNAPFTAAPKPLLPVAVPDPQPTQEQAEAAANFAKTNDHMCDRGWTLDHSTTDGTAFYYKERVLTMVPADVAPDATTVPNVVPTQLSVLFVNNLAQIPLAGYQYPTYQHIGPCSSMVSLVFESKGERDTETSEPVHKGVAWVSSMAHELEEQYHRLRTTFRKVDSVQRMQAVTVISDVLNLLGVQGLMLDQVTTETVADAADLVILHLTASQYENVFEDIGSYKDGKSHNEVHAAYKDLGLTDLTVDPGMYFVDYNEEYRTKMKENLGGVLKVLQETAKAQAAMNTPDPGTQGHTPASLGGFGPLTFLMNQAQAAPSLPPIAANNLMPSDPDEVMRMTQIPGYNMAEAFPTFKLFFMEDANQGVFHQFDNFYSYASISDIEIIKPKDKPWTMVLQMTNLAHLLNHKLFDDTDAGRLEYEYASRNGALPSGTADDGSPINQPGGIGIARKRPGEAVSVTYGQKRSPVKYFPLQTGTKVQLRIGYQNDPDKLTPVFGGVVTEIQGDDVLVVTCQSFLLELAAGSAENVPRDTWWQVGAILESAPNSIPIVNHLIPGSVTPGPAFGGVHFLGHDGDAGTVMGALIRDAKAKHFGHWQVKMTPDFFLKGYDWIPAIGEAVSSAGAAATAVSKTPSIGGGLLAGGAANPDQLVGGIMTAVGALVVSDGAGTVGKAVGEMLQKSANRADENILINRVIGADGTTKGRGSALGEAGGWNPIRPYSYYVDSKSTMSIWELIRDVSRRYPEYILAEKLYGFPRSCDATLVFGHPLDWYYSRENSKAETDNLQKADQDKSKFSEWWKTEGERLVRSTVKNVLNMDQKVNHRIEDFEPGFQRAGKSPEALEAFLKDMLRSEGQFMGWEVNNDAWYGGLNRVFELVYRAGAVLTPGNQEDRLRMIGGALRNVLRAYEAYVIRHTKNLVDLSRLKPIRQYHFIDHNTIVHNGMAVNDKIYNAVRIGDGASNGTVVTFKANGLIPDQHIRTLDVTDLINDPKQNVINPNSWCGVGGYKSGLSMAYAQSFLREEVGKMYRGEIVLRGAPTIEPWDILLLLDPSTGIVGSVEVDQVIHSFNLENGYITIVKPRALVAVNEASSAQFVNALMNAMALTLPTILRAGSLSGSAAAIALTKLGVGTAAGALSLRLLFPALAKGAVLGSKAAAWASGAAADAATVTGAAAETAGLTATGAAIVEGGVAAETGLAAAGGVLGTATSGTLAAGAAAFFASPAGWVVIGVLCVSVLAVGIMYWTDRTHGNTPLIIVPVMRFNRPWVGGLQGWRVTDLIGVINGQARQYWADEISPLMEMVETAGDLARTGTP